MSSKVVLTYKRKRFSTKVHLEHGLKKANFSPDSLHPIAESGCYSEKLNKDNEEFQNSTSTRRQDSEESTKKQVQEKKRTRRNQSIGISEMGPVKLLSPKVLSNAELPESSYKEANSTITDNSVKNIEDSFLMDFSCKSSGSACKVTCVEEISRSKPSDLGDSRIRPVCLNSPTERKYSSDCSDSILKAFNSDNVLLNKKNIKENYSRPLITFRRRIKKKNIISPTLVEKNLEAEDNQFSSANWSSHALEANCEPDNSSQKCSFKDQSTAATVPLEQADISTSQILQHDAIVGADNDVNLDSAPAGGLLEVKSAGDGGSTVYGAGLNPDCVECAEEEPSNKRMAAPTADDLKDPILLMHKNGPSVLVKVGTTARGKSGNDITTTVNNSEKLIASHDTSEKCQIRDLNLSAALPSCASPSNGESNKPSVDVMPENLVESQNSNPSCIELFDDEADGRGKELEWLESLDKALQEAKKDKGTRRTSPTIPSKSSVQIERNQGESKEYMNQIRPLQERMFLTGSGEQRGYEKQHEETSNRSSLCTNFVGLSFPLNSGVPVGSVKDSQNMHPRSSIGFKEADYMYNGKRSWHTLDENSSMVRHKQIVDDVITGTNMLTERQGSFLDKYKRYSNEWSEEELDFLWIGVRRHGIYNWSSMLRDPKLHFSELRVAEDLARRWDLEQRKLLNGARNPPASLSRPVISSSSVMDSTSLVNQAAAAHYGGYGSRSRAYSEFPMTPAETKLSLGDLYLRKENSLKKNSFHFSGLGTTNQFTASSSSTASFLSSFPIGSNYPNAGIRNQKLARPQNPRYDWESSILCQKSGESSSQEPQPTGLPASGIVPHWLKEVLRTLPGPRDSVLPTVSPVAQSVNLLNKDMRVGVPFPNLGDPHKDARSRGILKRKNSLASGNKSGALKVSDVPTATNESWIPTRLGTFTPSQKPASGVIDPDKYSSYDLNEKISGPKGPTDLVVIDSDATSEETISDDQS